MSVELDYITRIDYQNVLPSEITQRVDKILDFVRNSKDQWFAAKTPEEVNLNIPEIQSLVDRFHLVTSGFGEIEICLNNPAFPIYDVIALSFSTALATSWETVSDLDRFKQKENPGILMLELYKLGAARIGFKNVDG